MSFPPFFSFASFPPPFVNFDFGMVFLSQCSPYLAQGVSEKKEQKGKKIQTSTMGKDICGHRNIPTFLFLVEPHRVSCLCAGSSKKRKEGDGGREVEKQLGGNRETGGPSKSQVKG